MYCPACGNRNPDDAKFCTSCGLLLAEQPSAAPPPSFVHNPPPRQPKYGAPPTPVAEHVPNYLVQAILVTICCCLPAGIVAIVFAAQVNGKLARGDIIGARSDSQSAKTWAWVSFGLGLAAAAIYFFVFMIGAAAG